METLKFVFTNSFYPPYHLGGDANHVRYLAEELAKRGNEVHVIHSLDAYRVKRKNIPQSCESRGVILHTIETRFSRSAYEVYAFGASNRVTDCFRDTVRIVKPDIVHHHNISLLGYKILERCGSYMNLYTAHDYWLICPQSNLLRYGRQICNKASCTFCGLYYRRPPQVWRYRPAFKNAINQIDSLIAPCNYMRQKITRKFPVRAVTIPNFVPNPPNRISSSGFSRFLMYAGMLEQHKGVIALLNAYKELAMQTNLKLVIVGDGKLKQKLRELIRQQDLSGSVYLLGWVDSDLFSALLKDSASLVIPSIWPENAPLVALEALSVGTPVMASNLGGLPEIVSYLDPQLVFSWERWGDFDRAISYCLSRNSQLRRKARQVYLEHFTAKSYISSYLKLLARVAEAPNWTQ
ncbi:MAG: glycosyltransferase [Candidatus Bathyarchaeia archaeon]|jgi:glycosyltransferase involved in cell wall biosynthesis